MIDVTLLGTAATMPLPDRALASVLLRLGGRTILFDCGEGTQTAARKAKASLMKTDLIALTHYHGDHIFGLPGLLQTMGCLGRTDDLYITGPEGLKEVVEAILRLAGGLPYRIFLVPMPKEGIPFGDGVLKGFYVNHRVSTFGYEFSLGRPGKFDAQRADELGVPNELRGALQHGENVTINGELITPEMVMGPERKGIKIVISGDTAPCDSLRKAAEEADLFICEATYGDEENLPDAEEYGHSTFSQAARLARDANAKRLWLTHFSQMLEEPEDYIQNAREIYPEAVIGRDGMTINLGFE